MEKALSKHTDSVSKKMLRLCLIKKNLIDSNEAGLRSRLIFKRLQLFTFFSGGSGYGSWHFFLKRLRLQGTKILNLDYGLSLAKKIISPQTTNVKLQEIYKNYNNFFELQKYNFLMLFIF